MHVSLALCIFITLTLQLNSFQKAQYTYKSSNKYPSTRENKFFRFHVYACILSRKYWKQTEYIILCDGEEQLYFFQDEYSLKLFMLSSPSLIPNLIMIH